MKKMNADKIGNDCIICKDGSRQILKVNHFLNITRNEGIRLVILKQLLSVLENNFHNT